jgi:hypothetical protein
LDYALQKLSKKHGGSWKDALKGAKPSYIQKKSGGGVTRDDIKRLNEKGIKVDGQGGRWLQQPDGNYVWLVMKKK